MSYIQSGIASKRSEASAAIPGECPPATSKIPVNLHITNVEEVLATARPRLVRLAQRRGVAPDAIDDVVQETLVEAWEHLNALRMPDRFDAWLDGICRNMCLRWSKMHQRNRLRLTHLPGLTSEDACLDDELISEELPDPMAFDPAEELSRQDLSTLLDRALGYLPEETRQLIELCYLAELPQRETALRLGLTVNVLEARLHRARRRLRQVLNSELRVDALAFGLALEDETWRESREWCWYCGRHRLLGAFEPLTNGRINLHMRCPECSTVVNTGGLPRLDGFRSFKPALKRLHQATSNLTTGLENGMYPCPSCEMLRKVQVLHPDELAIAYPDSESLAIQKSMLVMDCSACAIHVETSVDSCLWQQPAVQRFLADHPRSFIEPETMVEYDGQPAIRFCMTDVTSSARLILLAHHRTLATYQVSLIPSMAQE